MKVEFEFLFEDGNLVAVNKPPGILAESSSGCEMKLLKCVPEKIGIRFPCLRDYSFFARNPTSAIRVTKGWDFATVAGVMKSIFKVSKLFLVLALLPASASAALIVSDWTTTPTSLSFKITGEIDGGPRSDR